MQLIRCIKAFCSDFGPIREILTGIGATRMEQKEQCDYFFLLYTDAGAPASRRLKLRFEDNRPRWLYYYDRAQDSSSLVTFRQSEVHDEALKDILTAALGIDVVVRKRREVWRAERAIFNLDLVHDVGQIFEVELEPNEQDRHVQQRKEYERLFKSYLGTEIQESNEDLIRGKNVRPHSR